MIRLQALFSVWWYWLSLGALFLGLPMLLSWWWLQSDSVQTPTVDVVISDCIGMVLTYHDGQFWCGDVELIGE